MHYNALPTYRLADITIIDFLRELFPNIPAADFGLETISGEYVFWTPRLLTAQEKDSIYDRRA